MTLTYIIAATFLGGVVSVALAAALSQPLLTLIVRHLVSLSTGVLLGTALLLFARRRDPALAKCPLLAAHVLPAGLNALIVAVGFVRHMFRARFPCFVVLWTLSLAAPMYVVLVLQARSLHLLFEYQWSKRMQALLHATESSLVAQSAAPYVDSALQRTVLTQPELRRVQLQVRSSSPQPTLAQDHRDWYWMKRHGTAAVVWAVLAVQLAVTLGIQLLSPYYRVWPRTDVYRCAGSFETRFPFYALLVHLFVVPAHLVVQLRRINDSYGARQDLFNTLIQAAWLVIALSLRYVYFIEQFVGHLPTGFALMAGFGLLHYHSVCAPLLRVYNWHWARSRKSRRMRQLLAWRRRIEAWLFPRAMRIGPRSQRRPRADSQRAPATPPPAIIDADALVAARPRRTAVSLFLEHFGHALWQDGDVASVGGVGLGVGLGTGIGTGTGTGTGTGIGTGTSPHTSTYTSPYTSPYTSTHTASPSPVPAIATDLRPPLFSQVLQDEHLCELFERYTLLEFSRENLLFYRAVCQLRAAYAALPHGAAQIFLVEKSRAIHAQFIKPAAPAEINIPGALRRSIEQRLADVAVDIGVFDDAQKEVFRLMQNWSFPRFLRTLPEDEIRRFNRRAQRRGSCAAPDDAPDNAAPLRVPRAPPGTASPQSVATLAMPAHIAHVHLSASP